MKKRGKKFKSNLKETLIMVVIITNETKMNVDYFLRKKKKRFLVNSSLKEIASRNA